MNKGWFDRLAGELLPNHRGAFKHIFDSMQYRDFRLYFYGQCISQTGTWMQQIAMSWLVYRITGSVLMLGTVVFLAQIPLLFVTPFMSVLVDRYDKRRILLITQTLALLQALMLAVMVLSGAIDVMMIMVLSFFIGCINSLDMPTRQSFYPSLVPQENLSNAVAMNSAIMNGSRLIGPALGGLLVEAVGEGGCFLVNAVSFIFVLWALWKIRPMRTPPVATATLKHQLTEGFMYVKGNLPIRVILLLLISFSFCAFNVMTLIPAYVKDTLGGSSALLGFVMASFGVGAFGAALFLAARKRVLGLGRVVILAMLLSGSCISVFFFIHTTGVAVLIAALLGFGLIGSLVSINTLLQLLSDYAMRGRVMGYYTMGFIGCSALGSLFWSWVSKQIGISWAMLLSGLLCMMSALVFCYYRPLVRKYARVIYIEKGIIPQIAAGIDAASTK